MPRGGNSGSNPNRMSNSMSQLRTPRGYGQQNILGDRNWSLKATYVEIYNEQLRDLLVSDSTPFNERNNVAIREDTKGNILLTGLRQVEIHSVDDLMSALNFGSAIRQTDATAINAKSSRSHAVFSLNLVQRKSKLQTAQGAEKRFSVPLEAMTGQEVTVTTDSKLHFVDLAGSERLKNTGAQGERAKEGISINAGLASLGKVISQLSSRQSGSHVSYRDSKLTRLLQDSLGGNAITYMIACVTPAEFHLSETLNTVQYAQRARAIQSKPRIQQVEEGDKQAIIERLRAEVSFLRDQIRSAADGTSSPRRGPAAPSDRSDRQNEREVELQNQLLDAQENYNALGQRHARLISEMAKAREHEENSWAGDAQADSATDRLNRSNSFAQAVEQVVLEYEKTIQSLEQSLSNTRTTLSNTETSLLEKETKCAYAETISGQLQSRLQKLMDREASTEHYLHDLEAKLDGHTSGEEKNATIIMELRKEIARVRENEASCEDYISTLEERLAEADQDGELMQREIDRLEQVIERQRSLGRLDALLYELDHVDDAKKLEHEGTNGFARGRSLADRSRSQSLVSRQSQLGEPIPEDDEHFDIAEEHDRDAAKDDIGDGESQATERAEADGQAADEDAPQSPAQSRFVADKLESVTQELIDLRVEHEATVDDFHQLHAKYEEARRALAELQDAVDEARHPARVRDSVISVSSDLYARPEPFGFDAKSLEMKDEPRSSISRSLSSELSSAMNSPGTADTTNLEAASDDETATTKHAASTEDLTTQARDGALTAELDRLRTLAGQREAAEKELASKYAELESKHSETLDIVEELKTEVSKARAVEIPRQSTPVIRRKSSQNVMIDRAHRSFASLRNIASENFEGQPEVMQNFELNLNAAMHELHSRSERIQELEADVASAKKEMETKMTIISGLTRERSSLKAGPMDMSMVATLRDQLEKNEKQLVQMREANASRERELTTEIEGLRKSLEESSSAQKNGDDASSRDDEAFRQEHEEKITKLQAELASWEGKHNTVLDAMRATEAELRDTVQQLEAQVATLNASLADLQTKASAENDEAVREADQKHQNLIGFLRSEMDEYKAIINSNSAKVAELETAHKSAESELGQMTKAHGEATEELARHQDLVAKLEEQIAAHCVATRTHQESLDQLESDHAKELAGLKAHEQKGYEEQVEVLMTEHADSVQKLEAELSEARDELMKVATQVAFALGVGVSVEKLTEQIDSLVAAQEALAEEQKTAGEMKAHLAELTAINESIARDLEAAKSSLTDILAEEEGASVAAGAVGAAGSIVQQLSVVKNKMSDLENRNKKHSRLVEELEEQLQNNFDEAQMTNNRLSTLQAERNAQFEEVTTARSRLQAELESIREEYAALQAKYHDAAGSDDVKRSDSNSTIRKSASHASLPSPPPAIPLPPLPSGAARSGSPTNGLPTSPTSARPPSKDNFNISQLSEDHEARVRTIEKHLFAERQLTQTLEEALTDLEKQSKKVKADCDAWKKRAHDLEGEVKELKDRPAPEPQQDNRWSLHAVEEERKKRQAAEAARKQLEERMNAINKGKKKKGSLNCF
ncbi:Chromosome-associated kinesin KIF4A [Tolypocladium capitatum]|uniref:Chromosome-associated kinesin KIF4A n=1 Tax=Tolypocladium capitatum TaxID=45235 RepID=A0A2K3QA74_9HYPO|nr:Chromosome-associated kinesin KIF4A [Tolypocladium capitatum]